MEFFHFFYFTLLTLPFISFVFASDPYSEALLSLKSELVCDTDVLSDWTMPSENNPLGKISACSWSGVKCNQNSTVVIALDLSLKNLGGVLTGNQFSVFTQLVDLNFSYNSFSGKLPVGIFNLSNLISLDISRNNFSGQFPNGISGLRSLVVLDAFSNSFSGPLPVEISELENLKILNLAGSYFSGPIPSEYGSFKSLEFIHLAGNLLGGNIPAELGKLKTVTHMEIGYNSYEGGIPWQLGNMSELQYLDIAGANLSGSIPKELSNLTKLESLFLFRNELSGLVPSEFSNIVSLISLDLSDNQLSGPIPESFSELKNLRLLSLMCNEMNGTVPEGIAKLPSLDTLLIWSNFFSGSLPPDLGKYSKLKWVDVSTNNFVGNIPPDICAGGELFKLILFSNNFTGTLSPISNCLSFVRLRLEDNSFSGQIPLKFSHLSDITYVDLSKNNFTGGIPSDISQSHNLQYFNISYNPGLAGIIPDMIWSSPLLQNFSASGCNISGNLPSFESCKSVAVIELQKNSLVGNIPSSISSCQNLVSMNLADNEITGNMPEELATLPSLSFLDLSYNNLSGTIPKKLGASSSLVLLNVSFNDISGLIPSSNVFSSMGKSAYVGNSKLCGAPLQSCSSSMTIFGSNSAKKLTWTLLLCVGVIMFIVASGFGIFYIRRRSKEQWRMVSFSGIPHFKAKDVLRSFNAIETMPSLSASVCKAVLPTGITVSVKKVELEAKTAKTAMEFVARMGNARHKNVVRLLGFCHNKHLAYLLYDYLPNGNLAEKISVKRDWVAKYKLIIGIARGLCFLHHDCYPEIPHGDLKSSNILFDENMEPHLAEFGIKFLAEITKGMSPDSTFRRDAGASNNAIKEELYKDIYNFGEIILEVITNGRWTNAGQTIQSKPKEALLRDVYNENEPTLNDSMKEEFKQVLEVALLCTKIRPSDRPSMELVLKLLSGPSSRSQRK